MGVNKREGAVAVVSRNALANSTYKNNWSIKEVSRIDEITLVENNNYIFVLVDWGEKLENLVNELPIGNFFLFGEHDNLNSFIDKGSVFNKDRYLRKSPWTTNKPFMTRNLWCASLHDPFYCSNIGATLKPLGKLRPLAWEYDSKGLPRILIAKHSGFRKSITYIGDSDPIVDFLAPYNSFFLKSLFNQSCTSNMLLLLIIFTAMLFLLLSQYKRKDIILLLIIIIFIFFIRNDIQGDTNIYDFSIKHVEKMNTPHVENDSAYIVNALSKAGFVVTLQGNSNASKRLIITNDTMRINTSKENKNTPVIVFMKPKAVIMLNNKRYSISDIPLGTVKVLSDDIEYLIPDARNILVNGKIESPLARDQQYTFIGTASPQRFVEYERFIK